MQIFSTYFATIWLQWWSGRHFSIGTGSYLGVYSALTATQVITMMAFPAYLLMYLVPKSSRALHARLLHATMSAPYRFFLQTDAGVILTRFSQDMSLIDKQLAGAALMFSFGLFSCIAEAILIALGQKFLAIGIIPIVGILYLLQNFYLRISRQLRFLELEAQSGLYTQFMETIDGIATIQAFGWQHNSKSHFMHLLDTAQRPFYMMFCIQRWLNFMLDIIVAIVAASVVAIAVLLPSTTSAGAIGVSMVNILNFGQSLAFLITTWTALETSLGAVARVKNFEATIESEDGPEARNPPPQNWPQSGSLELCNFSAAYSANSANAIRAIDLKIKNGEKIGICGRSGSGKSSLVLALLRMMHTTVGSILLDSHDISLVPSKTVRKQISCVPQESLILPGTVRFNIDPLSEKSDGEIAKALEKVGLWQLLVAGGGLDGEMVKMSLSGGQKQLLGLARILLRKDQAKILVLDEVASSVDVETERRMMDIIAEEFRESTVIAVAHRLQSVKEFDRIVVMDLGRIVECGHPHDLLETEGSLFRDLWNRQSRNQ
ncbi:hypothetical protein VTL71DRAFT_1028 [Oculimacula yallundae]|uniref:Uncharacterized protein n=1 Tax=Oculimacula yallundae TaxID=86028 RepID=A0ABR4D1X8_9HELO